MKKKKLDEIFKYRHLFKFSWNSKVKLEEYLADIVEFVYIKKTPFSRKLAISRLLELSEIKVESRRSTKSTRATHLEFFCH